MNQIQGFFSSAFKIIIDVCEKKYDLSRTTANIQATGDWSTDGPGPAAIFIARPVRISNLHILYLCFCGNKQGENTCHYPLR